MSANPEILQNQEPTLAPTEASSQPRSQTFIKTTDWNPKDFAREQIRGLVRRVFFGGGRQPVKHVVFSAAEPGVDVAQLCHKVGWALAAETQGHIAIVSRTPRITQIVRAHPHATHSLIKPLSTQLKNNLWHVPELSHLQLGLHETEVESGSNSYWLSWLALLRSEFEYTVIQAPVASISSEAALMAQLADGIILVLEARSSRKATLRKIKEVLESTPCRILGTVLSERAFPMPERIYRRL